MNYAKTIDYLFKIPSYQDVGEAAYKPELQRIRELVNYINTQYQSFRSVHIAGTNGKGSVANILASILQEAGYKVGLYTSPHLKSFRERIKINGEEISEEAVVDFIRKAASPIESLNPSFFETTTAMAFHYFDLQRVDVAIVEVGLGGRLDATNIINPVVSVITNIGTDHSQYLGNTIPKIAFEKAGIIKEKTPVVIGEFQEESLPVFKEVSQEVNAPLHKAWESFEVKREGSFINILKNGKEYLKNAEFPLLGAYQEKNIKTVLKTIEILENQGFFISKETITSGLKNIYQNLNLKGRWQVLAREPLIITDIAHNKEGLAVVIEQLLAEFSPEKIHFIIGFSEDKPLDKILPLFPKEAKFYFTSANIKRAVTPAKLKNMAKTFGLKGTRHYTVNRALETVQNKAKIDEVIFIGGSAFVVAEIV